MTTQTSSRIAAARAALVSAVNSGELTGKAFYAFPGAVLGSLEEYAFVDGVVNWTIEDANIKAGRRHRNETFMLLLEVRVFAPEVGAEGAQTALERLLTLTKVVEDALADDVTLGGSVDSAILTDGRDVGEIAYDTGWRFDVTLGVECKARLI